MDELKEIYGIELTNGQKRVQAISILADKWEEMNEILASVSNSAQRIDALTNQEAIKFMLSLLGRTE